MNLADTELEQDTVMNVDENDPIGAPRRRHDRLYYAMVAVVTVIGAVTLVGLAGGVWSLTVYGQDDSTAQWVLPALLVVVGITAVSLMVSVLVLMRRLKEIADLQAGMSQQTAVLAEQSVARSQLGAVVEEPKFDPAELKEILSEIRETLLLPADQRARRFQALINTEFTRRLTSADRFVRSRDFHRARSELEALIRRFGEDERVRQAQQKLEQAAEAARATDITQASKRVEDLMGLTLWDQAGQCAAELVQKYPVAPEAGALVERIERERKLFERNHRHRMHDEIQQFVHERRWREARDAARLFVAAFPTGVDTDALRQQIGTLEANADIQTRQEMERKLKEQVRQHQYWDALAMARRIIMDHPLSPQANVLRAQLPRLEELARKQGSPA